MVDTTLTPVVTPPVASVAAASAAVPTAPIETAITSLPDKIQQLMRQIQVNATVTQLPGDGTAILNSVIGPLTIQLPQLTDAQGQKLLQQLTNLIQTQRPLTVIVQPGSPPTQAFLFLPPTSSASATPPVAPTPDQAINQAVNQVRVPVVPGATLPAIVLPPSQVPQSVTTAQQPVPTYVPPTATPQTEIAPELAPITAALSDFANDVAPELVNTPAFQEIAAKAEITAAPQPAQSPLPVPLTSPLQNTPELNTPSAPTALPAGLQSVPQPTSLATTPTQLPSQPQAQALATAPQIVPATTAPLAALPTTVTPTTVAPSLLPAQPPALALLQSGNEVTLQVDSVIPSTVSLANLPSPGPNQILATVTSSGPNGQVLLQAGDTTLYVKQAVDVPVGTNLLLTVEPAKNAALQTLAAPDVLNFSNLQSVLSNLAQIDPQLAQQVLANHIPQATEALPGALLFFMTALKQSSVRSWLGDDAVDALSRAGKYELLSKLTQDLARSGQDVSDPVVGDWKSYPVPLQNNGQFQILNFYVHGDGGRQQDGQSISATEEARKKHTRFLIDVQMSKLGSMQLDGFIQPKKLDIIVRSEHVLPEGMHNELRQVYIKSLGGINYAGSLNFQVGRHHWLVIQNAKAQAAITT
jgi:hypothetical protein